jgi:hypothetical protein
LDEVYELTSSVLADIDVKGLKAKYEHLNLGQQRMNLGNRIRGVVNSMNKEKEGSGDKYVTHLSSGLRQAVKGREKEVEAKAKAREAEKLAKLKEKESKPSKDGATVKSGKGKKAA